jgi:EmrB/QacA subfamily drug resistance transporter
MENLHSHHENRWIILGIMSLSLVIVMLNNVTLNVALPKLAIDLNADNTQLQWIMDAYALIFGGTLLVMGSLGDRFGRRSALQLGLVVLAGSAAWAAFFAETADQVIAARAMMGLGAALVMPATLSIVIVVFPKEERGKAIGIWAAMAGVGAPIGLLVGGYIMEHYDWQIVFLINVPIIIFALIIGALVVPESKEAKTTPLDWIGSFLSILTLSAILYGIIEGPNLGWSSNEVIASFVIGIVSLIVFIKWENHTPHPILPMSFFSNRGYSVGLVAISLAFFVMFSFMFMQMLHFQLVRGYSPLEAALRFLPLPLGLMPAAANSDKLVAKFGVNRVVGSGLLLVTIALAIFSQVSIDTPYVMLALMFLLLGLGMGLTMAPSTTVVMDAIPADKAGVGSATNDASREVGGALGIAIGGSALNELYQRSIVIPPGLEEKAELINNSFPAAIRIGQELKMQGNPAGEILIENARFAFIEGMQASSLIAGIIALTASIIAYRMMPKKISFSEDKSLQQQEE